MLPAPAKMLHCLPQFGGYLGLDGIQFTSAAGYFIDGPSGEFGNPALHINWSPCWQKRPNSRTIEGEQLRHSSLEIPIHGIESKWPEFQFGKAQYALSPSEFGPFDLIKKKS